MKLGNILEALKPVYGDKVMLSLQGGPVSVILRGSLADYRDVSDYPALTVFQITDPANRHAVCYASRPRDQETV